MVAKRTLNASNLEALGAGVLAELLIEVSAGNAVIQRRLRLALASAGGAEGAAQEVRKRLTAIARSTTFIDSAKRKALLADLKAQQQAISGPIATADPALAVDLQVRLLELSEAGLLQLEEALLERGGVDRSTREQLTRGRGDLDRYLELFEPSQLTWPDTAAEVAGHLLSHGRATQALAVLDRAAGTTKIMEAKTWHATRIAVLDALGRSEEAQQHRWQVFAKTLSVPMLREYLQGLEDFADVEAEEQAFAVAEQHRLPLAALQFLILGPCLPRAARYVIDHCHDWDGDAYEI
jgi:hypothetical protein